MHHDLMSRLKDETAASHTQLENALDLMRPEWTREQYVALLQAFHGYVSPWENAVASHLPADQQEFFAPRRRAALLARDITTLTGESGRVAQLPLVPALPPLDSIGQLFGSLYVMEGSTLGGRFIAPHIARVLGLEAGEGNAYFEAYGPRTGSMWNAFRETAAASVPAGEYESAIASARATFDGLHAWLVRASVAAGATA